MRISEILSEGPLGNLIKKGAAALKRDFVQGYHPGDAPQLFGQGKDDQETTDTASTNNFKQKNVQAAVTAATSGKGQFTASDEQILKSFAASEDGNLSAAASRALKGTRLNSRETTVLQNQIRKYY